MALVIADRVQQTGTANTTVSFNLSSNVTGFQSFAVIGNGNTTYYAATDATGNWEVGVGTYSTTGPILTRTTIIASSNSNTAVTFSGTVTVFVTYPAEDAVYANGTVLVAPSGALLPTTNGGTGTSGLSGYVYGNGGSAMTASTTIPTSALTGTLPVVNGGTGASTASITSFNNITGYSASGATGTTSSNLVFSTSPTLTTPALGAATATSIVASNGLYSTGTYGGSYTDGIVLDYATGNGRVSVGTGDNLTFYTGGLANTATLTLNTSGAIGVGSSPSYGTSGQFLTSSGSGSAPTWTTPSSISQAKATALVMTLGF